MTDEPDPHDGSHPDCFDCETVKCPDCCENKHRSCFGAPCCCDCEQWELENRPAP